MHPDPYQAIRRAKIDALTPDQRERPLHIYNTQSRTNASKWLKAIIHHLGPGDLEYALAQNRSTLDAPLPLARCLAGSHKWLRCTDDTGNAYLLHCRGIRCTIRILAPGSTLPPGPSLTLPDGRTLADVRLIDPASRAQVQQVLEQAVDWLAACQGDRIAV